MFGKLKTSVFMGIVVMAGIMNAHFSYAALKDSDVDGLTDDAEVNTYHTNPNNHDTDGDSFDDGFEITQQTNPIDGNDTPLVASKTSSAASSEMPIAWYVGRASGIVAFLLFSIVVINGLLMTTRLVFKILPPALNYGMHQFLASMGAIALLGHIVALTLDKYFQLRWSEVWLPFSVHRAYLSPIGADFQVAVGLGTLAMYGIIALIVTSKIKGKYLSVKVWRVLHFMSFPAYFLFLAHGIASGTDTKTWWMLWLYGLSAVMVFGLVLLRIVISVKKLTPSQPSSPLM